MSNFTPIDKRVDLRNSSLGTQSVPFQGRVVPCVALARLVCIVCLRILPRDERSEFCLYCPCA